MNTTRTCGLVGGGHRLLVLILLAGLASGVTVRSVAASDVLNYYALDNAIQITIRDLSPNNNAQDQLTEDALAPVNLAGIEGLNVTSDVGSQTVTLNALDLITPLELITISTGGDDDSFSITPASSAPVYVDGGSHTNGDTLIVDAQGAVAVDTGTTVEISGFQDISYTDVETVTIVNAAKGAIVIEKQADPKGAAGTFGFSDDVQSPLNFSLDDGETQGFTEVTPGTYTITETNPAPGFDLVDITCSDCNSAGSLATGAAMVHLESGETVTCTFTNRQRGEVTVIKDVVPDDGGEWRVALAGPTSAYADLGDGESHTFGDVIPGFYTAGETVGADTFNTVDCGPKGDDRDSDISFLVEPGEHVTCTFTNTVAATLVIEKQAVCAGVTNVISFEVPHLGPGTYPVTENLRTPGSELTAILCADSGSVTPSTWDLVAGRATYGLDPAEMATCTFINRLVGAPTGGVSFLVNRLRLLAPWIGAAGVGFLTTLATHLVAGRRIRARKQR